jgi:hypothetical protein
LGLNRLFPSQEVQIPPPSSPSLLAAQSRTKPWEDILINGQMNTMAYHPVAVNGKNFLTLYIIAKYNTITAL